MKWITKRWLLTSECGRYAIEARYIDGHFEWRGRFLQTDELVASSADLDYVQQCCERHVEKLSMESA